MVRYYQVFMVLHHIFMIRICKGFTEVGYSPPIILQFSPRFYYKDLCLPSPHPVESSVILQHTSGSIVTFMSFCCLMTCETVLLSLQHEKVLRRMCRLWYANYPETVQSHHKRSMMLEVLLSLL